MIQTPKPVRHYQHQATASMVFASFGSWQKDKAFRERLREGGFNFHHAPRNWLKFGDSYADLLAISLDIWQSNPGKILFEVKKW